MGRLNDAQLQCRIEHILERHPNASSLVVRQRLMSSLKPSHIYPHLVPFYEQYRIDDSADIQRELKKMMSMHLGLSIIAQTLSIGCFNYLQVEKALLELTADFDHLAQAQRCKELRFGHGAPTDEHHQSQIVMTLQRLGHRLPDIWQVLRQATESNKIAKPR
ncbi:hypothetical protein NB663_07235 [Vibrio parahaemolyticus]|uniref:hypothetical protein n=1 Tax=Vibrio parahaemolyticus TaxID=670 RepID=UPI00215BE3E5|nr:hypothetical protein [Vibrio parahaemolyticus]EJE4206686.1 hypothetical protein [Vibrio parahaemolyticus]MCR9780326.1 hypothetical protein [Vibrio parahaemolyticus]